MKIYEPVEIEIIALNSSDILTESLGAGDNEGSFDEW